MRDGLDPAGGHLVGMAPDVRPATFALDRRGCTMGRSASCDIVVERPFVSRLHARIEASGPRFLLRDEASANGAFVNGRRIQETHLLADRDQIGLGAPEPVLRFLDPDPTLLPASRLRFDESTLSFALGGHPLELTPNEFRLLRVLYSHAGAVCTRERCAEGVWGPDYPPGHETDALDRLISNLRRKLREADPDSAPLQTRAGLGSLLDS